MPPAAKRTTIAILGGNAVVGRALEVLLRSVGYEVRLWLEDPEAYDGPEELLEGVDVLLLGPGLDAAEERREKYLRDVKGVLETAAIAVLAFSPGQEGTIAQVRRLVPWPCRVEELAREIEAVLPSRHERVVGPENNSLRAFLEKFSHGPRQPLSALRRNLSLARGGEEAEVPVGVSAEHLPQEQARLLGKVRVGQRLPHDLYLAPPVGDDPEHLLPRKPPAVGPQPFLVHRRVG